MKQRIGIDARFYGPIGKGLGRYTQEVVDNILKIDTQSEYVIFLAAANFDEFVVPRGQEGRIKKVLADVRWYSLKEQVLMPYYFWRENLDLVHVPHFNVPLFIGNKFVVTIHDLILTRFPTMRATRLGPIAYKIKNLLYRLVIKQAIRRAQTVITVSEFTKQDILNKFSVSAQKIRVVYEGVANLRKGHDSLFVAKLDSQEVLKEYGIFKDYLLYVGNAYPHKNLETLITIFLQIHTSRPNLHLILVGREDYFYQRLKDFVRQAVKINNSNQEAIIFPGYVPDQKLETLFQNAVAYVFPSLYEGFGLPPLEAMAKGCPVVSSNRASLPEILGAAALYFDPENREDMQNKILQIIDDQDLRIKLQERGYQQIKKYDWWECARQTREIYNIS